MSTSLFLVPFPFHMIMHHLQGTSQMNEHIFWLLLLKEYTQRCRSLLKVDVFLLFHIFLVFSKDILDLLSAHRISASHQHPLKEKCLATMTSGIYLLEYPVINFYISFLISAAQCIYGNVSNLFCSWMPKRQVQCRIFAIFFLPVVLVRLYSRNSGWFHELKLYQYLWYVSLVIDN